MKRFLTLLVFCNFIITAKTQWKADTLTGGKMFLQNIYVYDQENKVFSFTDGNGGIMHLFQMLVNIPGGGAQNSIRLQRCDSAAILLNSMVDSGLLIKHFQSINFYDAIADSAGGAYILYDAWDPDVLSENNTYLFLQHINSSGQALWGNNGKTVRIIPTDSAFDGKLCYATGGGVIAVWKESEYGDDYGQLYAQKFSTAGNLQWPGSRVSVCNAAEKRGRFNICTDGSGGVWIAFEDGRNSQQSSGSYDNLDIYTQHISSSGTLAMGAAGAIVLAGATWQSLPEENSASEYMLPDGTGGCYILYLTDPDGSSDKNDIYVQKLSSSGQRLWTGNGTLLARTQYQHRIDHYNFLTNPAAGGVSVLFSVTDEGFIGNNRAYLYLQNISNAGVKQYTTGDGKPIAPVFTNETWQYPFDALYNSTNELFFIFRDVNNGAAVKIQKIKPDGTLQWDSTGKTVVHHFSYKLQLIKASNGYQLMQWADNRNYPGLDYNMNYFASRFDNNGVFSASRNTIFSTVNGNWNNPSTWVGGIVPGAQDIVIIKHAISISSNSSCYSLTVQLPGSVNVQNGFSLFIAH